MRTYEKHTAEGHNFFFKKDLNPITNEMVVHIWARHCIEPETAIEVFFNQDIKRYNEKYKRWEGYSKHHELYIYYFFYKNNPQNVIVITVFSD